MRAFSLIETLMYLGLFALLMEGAFVGIFAISESADRNQTEAYLEEEGDFVADKISYEISQSSTVSLPNGTNARIDLIEFGMPVSIEESDDIFSIARNNSAAIPFSSNLVQVSDVQFIATTSPSSAVTTSFTLQAKTEDGRTLSEDFSTITYAAL